MLLSYIELVFGQEADKKSMDTYTDYRIILRDEELVFKNRKG